MHVLGSGKRRQDGDFLFFKVFSKIGTILQIKKWNCAKYRNRRFGSRSCWELSLLASLGCVLTQDSRALASFTSSPIPKLFNPIDLTPTTGTKTTFSCRKGTTKSNSNDLMGKNLHIFIALVIVLQ